MIEGCLVLDDFDSHLLSRVLPQTSHYLPKGALSKQVLHNVPAGRKSSQKPSTGCKGGSGGYCVLLCETYHRQESPSGPAGLPDGAHLRLLDESTSSTLRMRSLCSLSKPSLPRPSLGAVRHRLALAIFTPRHRPDLSERGVTGISAGNLQVQNERQNAQVARRISVKGKRSVHESHLKPKEGR